MDYRRHTFPVYEDITVELQVTECQEGQAKPLKPPIARESRNHR